MHFYFIFINDFIRDFSGGHQFKEHCFIKVILYLLFLFND